MDRKCSGGETTGDGGGKSSRRGAVGLGTGTGGRGRHIARTEDGQGCY